MMIVFIYLLTLIFSFIFVAIFRAFALKYELLNYPNERSSHTIPIPRGGGLAFIISFFLGLIVLHNYHMVDDTLFKIYCSGGVLVAGAGLLDDFGYSSIKLRLIVHFAAAFLILYFLKGMPTLEFGFCSWHWGWLGNVIGVLGIVWLINLYNFMDGIDGLAALEGIFVSTAIIFLYLVLNQSNLIWIPLLLAISLGGFLGWNWSPARIFMGDVGSGFLGFIFSVMLISSVSNHILTPWQWLILLGCFWVDATLTLLLRFFSTKDWYHPHCSHVYQQISKKTNSHKKVVIGITLINVFWLLPISLLSVYYPQYVLLLVGLALLPIVSFCAFFRK